jgi:hypothetical protein
VQRRDREETRPWLLISHQHWSRLRNFPGTQNRPERDAAEPALSGTLLQATHYTYSFAWLYTNELQQQRSERKGDTAIGVASCSDRQSEHQHPGLTVGREGDVE